MPRLDSLIGIRRIVLDGPAIHLEAEVVTISATCPSCRTPSTRVHARYVRRPLDLPWRGHTVRLILTVRRFLCDNPMCDRKTFAEDCGPSLPRFARRTVEATMELLAIAMVAGGEAGSRLAGKHHLPTSPDTLLRLQRNMPLPERPTPRVVGIDDLSLRRRQTYATIFVDLETHKPIDLVEGRDAQVVEHWLKARRRPEIVVRDRAEAYAEGVRVGAPNALQIADRFHLLQNVSSALDELLRSRHRQAQYLELPAAKAVEPMSPRVLGKLSPSRQRQMERRQSKAARRQRVKALREAGQTISQIGRALGLDRKTVRNYLNAPEPVQPQALSSQVAPSDPDRPRSPLLAPFVGYLQDRWQDGCHNASQLYRELVERGYVGSRSTLAQAVQGWREPGMSKRQQRLRRRTSLRWLVLRPPEQLKTEEKALLEEVLAGNPEIALGHELVQRFREVIAKRDVGALDEWLAASRRSGLPSFVGLANGIEGDRSAVEVALSLPWSSGPVEGQITRVKLIKRQGYGRAKLDLLRCRVLAA